MICNVCYDFMVYNAPMGIKDIKTLLGYVRNDLTNRLINDC